MDLKTDLKESDNTVNAATSESSTRGTFIVLEGTDGSGKGTQLSLLADNLRQAGHDIEVFDFPRYDEISSYFVKKYLNGEYGSAATVGPYTGSLFYALDRYDAAKKIREALEAGKIVLVNRFTASNMAHQGTKFNEAAERRGYFIWLDNMEFDLLGIPRPDLNVILRVPAEIAQKLVDQKQPRNYTEAKRDIHEADLDHLKKAVEVFDELCQLFPKDFASIDCVRNGELMEIDAIHKLIREKVSPWLPKPKRKNRSAETKTEAVAQVEAPASANEEFVVDHADDAVVETEPVVADEATIAVKQSYAIPDSFDNQTLQKYRQTMDKIINTHIALVAGLVYHIRQHSDTPQNDRDEAWQQATQAQAEAAAKPVLPVDIALVDQSQTLDLLASEHLASNYGTSRNVPVELTDVWPRNELNLAAEVLYRHSDLTLKDIRAQIAEWPYERKVTVLQATGVIEKAHYSFDVFCDYGTFYDLQQAGKAEAVIHQLLTPRAGYEVPELIEQAELSELYEDCFDTSLQLYSYLQQKGYAQEAQHAVLRGHRMRSQITYNASEIFRLGQATHETYSALANEMLEKVREVHPLLSEISESQN